MPPIRLSPIATIPLQSASAGAVTPSARWSPVAAGAAGSANGSATPPNAIVAVSPASPPQPGGLPARPGLQGVRRIAALSAQYAGPLIGGGGLYLAVTSQFARFGGGNGPAMPVDEYIAQTVAGSLLLGAGTALSAAGIWFTRGQTPVVAPMPAGTDAAADSGHDEENAMPLTPVV